MKESVTLRTKPLKDGGSSLFLDYTIDGIRYKDYLHMYLVPESGRADKLRNSDTMKIALAAKAKKIVEIQNGEAGFIAMERKDILFTDWLRTEQQCYDLAGKTEYAKTIGKILVWLDLYGKRVALRKVDREYLLAFFRFLRAKHPRKDGDGEKKKTPGRPISPNGLSVGTISTYSSTLSTLFNKAVRKRLIQRNPMSDLESYEKPSRPDSAREYLTLDEVRLLARTPCRNEEVKRAFLFACFTGIRLGDIERLTGRMIHSTSEGLEIEIRQQKTQKMVYVPISSNAASFLGEDFGAERVFNLPSRNEVNNNVSRWVKKADITKHITFHCSRHTYATMLLTYGADIYTVSKLMGHADVATTQVYAKIVDSKKRSAVDSIPSLGI